MKAYKQIRTRQKTPKRLEEIRFTWYKPNTAPRGATEAGESREWIERTHSCTERLNQREIDCKNTQRRQYTPE